MLSSKKLKSLQKYIDIIEKNRGRKIGDILRELNLERHSHFKKGASGLIVLKLNLIEAQI